LCANLIVLSLRAKFFTFLFIAFFPVFLYCVAACQAACCGYGFSVALPLALQKAVFRVAKGRELQRERPCFAS
jgi:hypothetical protein